MTLTDHLDEFGKQKPQKKRRDKSKQIEQFGFTGISVEDMATILRTSVARIQGFMNNPESKFYRLYRRGQALVKMKLSYHQIMTALGEAKGNSQILQHLGVTLLGQQPVRKQPEERDESAETLLQNVPKSKRGKLFKMLVGTLEKSEKIDDGTDE